MGHQCFRNNGYSRNKTMINILLEGYDIAVPWLYDVSLDKAVRIRKIKTDKREKIQHKSGRPSGARKVLFSYIF